MVILKKFTKKAQLSIFIIISLIIVMVSTFIFFSNDYNVFISQEDKVKGQISQLVKECILNDAKTGTFLLGFQGGYLELPKEIENDPINFRKRYVDLGLKIPNWDSQLGAIPSLNSMEVGLENYISNNSYSCIDSNLNALKDSLDINFENNLKVKASFNSNNVVVELNLPISFKEKNSENTFLIQDYFVKLDNIRIKELYALAFEIYSLESQKNIFENLVLEQIYSANDYSSLDSMPSEGMSFSCSPKIWTKTRLKDNLANLNNANFKYLQFDGTYSKDNLKNLNFNYELNTLDLLQYYESYTVGYRQKLNNIKNSFKDFDVEVTMPSTASKNSNFLSKYSFRNFEVSPSSGEIVKPSNLKVGGKLGISIPCIQIFHAQYDLDYDLMVKITDKKDNLGNFFFQFPLRVQIKNNQPKASSIPIAFSTKEPLTLNNDNFCSNESKKYPLYVYARDKKTGNLLDNVDINYECVSVSCDIGKTSKPDFSIGSFENTYLKEDFPFCIGGKIIAKKEGYFNGILKDVDTTNDLILNENNQFSGNGDSIKEVELIPKLEFNTDINSFLIVFKDSLTSMVLRDENSGLIYINIENNAIGFSNQIIYPNNLGEFNKLILLDDEDISYNISVAYSDKDSNLKGFFEIKNWKPDLNTLSQNSKVKFVIPTNNEIIDENNFQEYLDYVNFAIESSDYGIIFN